MRRRNSSNPSLVNAKGEIISVDNVSVGELSSTVVHPREVFSQAIRKSAAGVIFVHNHPSGDPSPSDEDIRTTERLVCGGEVLGSECWIT
jgi:DNA repair protein RadC